MAVETAEVAESGLRWNIARAAHQLVREHLVVGHTGNVSARHPDGFYITPTRRTYADMRAEEVVEVRLDDLNAVPDDASREWRMHAAVYAATPEAHAVVHTHSVHATAWSFLDRPLVPRLEEIEYFDIGTIRTAAPAPAASQELADGAAAALREARAVLLGRHGVVTRGRTLSEALDIARVVERQAHIAFLVARQGIRCLKSGTTCSTRRTPISIEC